MSPYVFAFLNGFSWVFLTFHLSFWSSLLNQPFLLCWPSCHSTGLLWHRDRKMAILIYIGFTFSCFLIVSFSFLHPSWRYVVLKIGTKPFSLVGPTWQLSPFFKEQFLHLLKALWDTSVEEYKVIVLFYNFWAQYWTHCSIAYVKRMLSVLCNKWSGQVLEESCSVGMW
jgi:hypothetical protein